MINTVQLIFHIVRLFRYVNIHLFPYDSQLLYNILNKTENATPDLFAFIYKMMQASKANESVYECSNMFLKGYPLEAKNTSKN